MNGSQKASLLAGVDLQTLGKFSPTKQAQNSRAVREAKRLLKLEFLHECAGGIAVHAALVQTFSQIGDTAGVCYAMRQLFAHAKAAHPIYLELRDETREAAS
ncbi:MAG TPA: hypothetical protein VGP28_04620 [Methylocella sp.]|nr:hypothetical protein [Methylocella sp.]